MNQIQFKEAASWVILSSIEQRIKEKIEKIGKPLKDWDVKIYRGVLTGYNEAFIIDGKTKDELIKKSAKNAEIIRPILRGRDVEKYKANMSDLWLLFIPWHFPLQDDSAIMGASKLAEEQFSKGYPAIYEYLLSYKSQLMSRNKAETGIRYEWYAMQRWGANYWWDFEKPKIIWKRIGSVLRFSYDETGTYCLDSTCFAIGSDLKYIVGYLNSSVCRRELLNNAPKTGTGDVITSVQALEPLLIPQASEKQKNEISTLVDRCIESLSIGQTNNISKYEEEIDNLIFDLYNLSKEERRAIEFVEI